MLIMTYDFNAAKIRKGRLIFSSSSRKILKKGLFYE